MRGYIMPLSADADLYTNLRKRYDSAVKKDWLSLHYLIGGRNPKRPIQIDFLERMLCVLHPIRLLLDPQRCEHPKDEWKKLWMEAIDRKRALIGCCLYIMSEITTSKSDLRNIICEILCIHRYNQLTSEDIVACCYAAKRVLNDFTQANLFLDAAGLRPFSEEEWHHLQEYLNEQISKKGISSESNFPVAQFCSKAMGAGVQGVGFAVGSLVGDGVAASSTTIAARAGATQVFATALAMGSTSAPGIALLAPFMGAAWLKYYLGRRFADAAETVLRKSGEGIGFALGAPVDISYKAVCFILLYLSGYRHTPEQKPSRGIYVTTGQLSIDGLTGDEAEQCLLAEYQQKAQLSLANSQSKASVELIENGIDGPPASRGAARP